ncbi:MAG: hypothetical protein ABFD96_11200 [Armatimonadia bacterium]
MRHFAKVMAVGLSMIGIVLLSGCVKVGVDMTVAPDGSSSATMLMGIDKNLEEMGEATSNPFADLAKGPDAKRWKVREYTEGNWKMVEAVGKAAPGEKLFTDEDAPKLTVRTGQHRLTTRYTLTLQAAMPEGIDEAPAAEGDEQMAKLMGAMMGSMEFKFALTGPGQVVATTGTTTGPGRAEWNLGVKDLSGKAMPDFKVTTELVNWTNLGRLADQIAARGAMYDAGVRLADAVDRRLLPNPPANIMAKDKLGAADYEALLGIIERLDEQLSPEAVTAVLEKTGLSDEDVTPAKVQNAHARLTKADLQAQVEKSAAAAAIQVITGK